MLSISYAAEHYKEEFSFRKREKYKYHIKRQKNKLLLV
jgi:hypothetical protein